MEARDDDSNDSGLQDEEQGLLRHAESSSSSSKSSSRWTRHGKAWNGLVWCNLAVSGTLLLLLLYLVFFGTIRRDTEKSQSWTQAPIDNVHYLMTATKATPGFCTSLSAAMVNDAKPIILTWNDGKDKGDLYWVKRMHIVRDYIAKETRKGDIIVMTDAFDAWLQRPLAELISKFKKSGKRILFGAERICWTGHTFEEKDGFRFCQDLPQSALPSDLHGDVHNDTLSFTRPRFLNAGSIIGYADDLLKMYDAVIQLSEETGVTDDQGLFLVTMYKGAAPISLDYYGDMLKPMIGSEKEMTVAPMLNRDPARMEFLNHPRVKGSVSHQLLRGHTPRLVFEINTKSFPAILHFNGPSKNMVKTLYEQMWWTPKHKDSVGWEVWQRVLFFLKEQNIMLDRKNDRTMRWSDFCTDNFNRKADNSSYLY